MAIAPPRDRSLCLGRAFPLGRGRALCTGPRAMGVVVGQWVVDESDAGIGIP
jgi:hypothetical protein